MLPKYSLRALALASAAIGAVALGAQAHNHEGDSDTAAYANLEGKVAAGEYVMDKGHGYVTFSYSHLGFSNPQLRYRDIDANLQLDPANLEASTLSVTIAADSIDTGVDIFDDHLNSADWFNTAEFPEITFTSTSFDQTADGAGHVVGDLTIMGTTKEVVLDVELLAAGKHPLNGKDTVGIDATATVLRSDFGLGNYAPNVSDEVEIVISAEFNKAG